MEKAKELTPEQQAEKDFVENFNKTLFAMSKMNRGKRRATLRNIEKKFGKKLADLFRKHMKQ